MPIQFECPSCGRNLKAPESTAGKTAKCPYCQAHVQVPEPVYEAEEPHQAEEPADRGYGVQAPVETPQEEHRRPCPMCGEMIKVNAVKCRYCGEIFDEDLKRSERRGRDRTRGGSDTDLSGVEILVAVLCSGIGCIVGIVYMIQGKPKGTKMFFLSLLFTIIWNVIRFAAQGGKF